ncbi:Glutathione S-transferase TCHQD [Hibiscus syriacus]|uniref:Glutathione S-transferase TCHQD n=1 Tax=Hibiscus syriacus TaxID=106335 RepID=A0A6A2YGJ3_HIBSY|nr:glutathione S-transferase TCHQD-like [Hibiscus syriacus]KAE8674547.1 Glutathione S-transferase TCHQD [Hibiscus syriacus]
MQLYHHPFSLNSQKVRLALEEKGVDYTSFHVNPILGKNMNSSFFRMNTRAKLPVFKNGSHIIFDTVETILYIERIAAVSVGNNSFSSQEVIEWMRKIEQWNPKYFTLSHIPDKHRLFVSKFIRKVVIARMAESPDLASAYHGKLREAYETEEKLKNPDVVKRSKESLVQLLDEVETKLNDTTYIGGDEFTMADATFIPVLARLVLLGLEDEYITCRPNIADYWGLVQQRPTYKKVIGKYFNGWRKKKTLMKTWCSLRVREFLRRY